MIRQVEHNENPEVPFLSVFLSVFLSCVSLSVSHSQRETERVSVSENVCVGRISIHVGFKSSINTLIIDGARLFAIFCRGETKGVVT